MNATAYTSEQGFEVIEKYETPDCFDYENLPHNEDKWHKIYWNWRMQTWKHDALENLLGQGYLPIKLNYGYIDISIRAAFRHTQWQKHFKKHYHFFIEKYDGDKYAYFHPEDRKDSYYFKSPVNGVDPVDYLNLAISLKRQSPKEPLSWRIKDLAFLGEEQIGMEIMTRKLAQ